VLLVRFRRILSILGIIRRFRLTGLIQMPDLCVKREDAEKRNVESVYSWLQVAYPAWAENVVTKRPCVYALPAWMLMYRKHLGKDRTVTSHSLLVANSRLWLIYLKIHELLLLAICCILQSHLLLVTNSRVIESIVRKHSLVAFGSCNFCWLKSQNWERNSSFYALSLSVHN